MCLAIGTGVQQSWTAQKCSALLRSFQKRHAKNNAQIQIMGKARSFMLPDLGHHPPKMQLEMPLAHQGAWSCHPLHIDVG